MEYRPSREAFQVVFAIAGLLLLPAALTLRHVGPFGYTWSLSLFFVPIAGLSWWFARRRDLKFPRAAFWRTIAVLAPLGFALDLLCGNAFFVFPNQESTVGLAIPALGGAIPLEEFVFYLTGFILTLLSYVWCDEYWLSEYNIPDYEAAVDGIGRIVRFHLPSVVLGGTLILLAILYRKMFSRNSDGFPWYFHLPDRGVACPVARFFQDGAAIHQLAGLQFYIFPSAPHQPALGGDTGAALWVVGLSESGHDRHLHQRLA